MPPDVCSYCKNLRLLSCLYWRSVLRCWLKLPCTLFWFADTRSRELLWAVTTNPQFIVGFTRYSTPTPHIPTVLMSRDVPSRLKPMPSGRKLWRRKALLPCPSVRSDTPRGRSCMGRRCAWDAPPLACWRSATSWELEMYARLNAQSRPVRLHPQVIP